MVVSSQSMRSVKHSALALLGACSVALLAACSSPPTQPVAPPAPAPAPVVAAPAPAPAPAPPPPKAVQVRALDAKTRLALEQALTCTSVGKGFGAVEAEFKKSGWQGGQGFTPVALTKPVTVFGLPVRSVAVSREGGEHSYRSHFGDATPLQVIKAASLKRSKDGQNHGRATKLGVLSLDSANGEVVLNCAVDTER